MSDSCDEKQIEIRIPVFDPDSAPPRARWLCVNRQLRFYLSSSKETEDDADINPHH